MNKIITIFIVLIAIIASFFAGYQVHKSRTVVIPAETSLQSDKEIITAANNAIQTKSENKFFELFNNFAREQDMSAPSILFSDVKNKLIAFHYPTSQETSDEGVYDYKNNIIYNKLTSATNDSENYSTILAFIDANTILVTTRENGKVKLVAMDFKTKKILKSVDVSLSEGQYIEAMSYYPYDNEIMIGIYNPHNSVDESNYPVSYILNTDTFSFNKRTGPQ